MPALPMVEPVCQPSYFWLSDVGQETTTVRLSLDLIERLEREIVANFRTVTRPGSEIGGVLLGSLTRSGGYTIFIDDYELVRCDYRRGPLYLFSEADKERLAETLCRLRSSSPLSAVGLFRANARKQLALDDEDLALMQEHFSGPGNVFLLVKPFAIKPSVAGCFIGDGRRMHAASGRFPFSFTRSELIAASSEYVAGGEDPGIPPAAVEPEPAAAAPPPEEECVPTAPPAAVPESPSPTTLRATERGWPWRMLTRRWLWISVLTVLLALAGAFFLFRALWTPGSVQRAESELGLKLECPAGRLVLTWNRNARLIAAAQRAVLSIADGDHKEELAIARDRLRRGAFQYSPISNDVTLSLELTDSSGRSVRESVRFLRGRSSPGPALGQPSLSPPIAVPAPAVPARLPRAASAAPKTAAPIPQLPAIRQPEPQMPQPPSLDTKPDLLAAPAAAPTWVSASAPPPAKETPKAAATPVRVGGDAQEAKVVRRVTPIYPLAAKRAHVFGTVRVEATIGTDGKVAGIIAVSGHPLLRQAAAEAVQRWIFQPALLNGQPVESRAQVDLVFSSSR